VGDSVHSHGMGGLASKGQLQLNDRRVTIPWNKFNNRNCPALPPQESGLLPVMAGRRCEVPVQSPLPGTSTGRNENENSLRGREPAQEKTRSSLMRRRRRTETYKTQ
jgi:hypothetical protein